MHARRAQLERRLAKHIADIEFRDRYRQRSIFSDSERVQVLKVLSKESSRRTDADLDFIVHQLKSVQGLRRLSVTRRREFCRNLQFKSVSKGEVLFYQGDEVKTCYFVMSGCVRLSGTEVVTAQRPRSWHCVKLAGSFLCEDSMRIPTGGYTATAEVLGEGVELLWLSHHAYSSVYLDTQGGDGRNLAALSALSAFEMPPSALQQLSIRCALRRYVKGQMVMTEGVVSRCVMFLSTGRVNVLRRVDPTNTSAHGKRVCTVSVNGCVGEESVPGIASGGVMQESLFTIVAATNVQVVVIDASFMNQLLPWCPSLEISLREQYAFKLGELLRIKQELPNGLKTDFAVKGRMLPAKPTADRRGMMQEEKNQFLFQALDSQLLSGAKNSFDRIKIKPGTESQQGSRSTLLTPNRISVSSPKRKPAPASRPCTPLFVSVRGHDFRAGLTYDSPERPSTAPSQVDCSQTRVSTSASPVDSSFYQTQAADSALPLLFSEDGVITKSATDSSKQQVPITSPVVKRSSLALYTKYNESYARSSKEAFIRRCENEMGRS